MDENDYELKRLILYEELAFFCKAICFYKIKQIKILLSHFLHFVVKKF